MNVFLGLPKVFFIGWIQYNSSNLHTSCFVQNTRLHTCLLQFHSADSPDTRPHRYSCDQMCLQQKVWRIVKVIRSHFSHWLLQNFHCRPPTPRSCLIFMIQDRGGFDSKFYDRKLVDLKMSKFFTSYVK